MKLIAAWGVLSGRNHQPEPARQGGRRAWRHHPPHLRAGGRAELRRGGLRRSRRHDRRGPRAGRAAPAHRREGAVLRGRARCHPRAHLVGHPREHDARLSAAQAILTAEAGATYLSCFMGRLDDISVSTAVVGEIVESLRGTEAQVLAASLRHPMHAVTAAELGCHVATVPGKVLRPMLNHPLTTAGIERFASDWQSRPEFGDWLRDLVESGQAAAS